jgi:aquaporin Z
MTAPLSRRVIAEFLGTFWLVLCGTGTAVLASKYVGNVGVAFAFGLTVLTMVYAIGHISGAHLNPAISLGLWIGKRFPAKDLPAYLVAQIAGAIAASSVLYVIASGGPDFSLSSGFAANGYGADSLGSPGHYSLLSAAIIEIVMTFFFVLIVHGATDKRTPAVVAGLAIGLGLTLVHLITIPVDNASVNPARSIAPAIFVGGWALSQLWLFIVGPVVGGLLAGIAYRGVFEEKDEPADAA